MSKASAKKYLADLIGGPNDGERKETDFLLEILKCPTLSSKVEVYEFKGEVINERRQLVYQAGKLNV